MYVSQRASFTNNNWIPASRRLPDTVARHLVKHVVVLSMTVMTDRRLNARVCNIVVCTPAHTFNLRVVRTHRL